MGISSRLDQIHDKIRQNRWHWLFAIFCRIVLALGFIPAGIVKIADERFASGLDINHPMGQYLEALHHTGYYYTTIGIAQVVAAILLLIPRTVLLGAFLYLPIIVNIWILSYALRFDGSHVTSPLMVLATLYILFWHYDRLKFILPFKKSAPPKLLEKPTTYSNRFPFLFAGGVIATVATVILFSLFGHEVMPRNSISDCKRQFTGSNNEAAGLQFCECIHTHGGHLNDCLEEYEKAKN